MKRVIIYGVTNIELRRNVEYFLDDDCEIVGYTDTYQTKDVIDGKTFILPSQLAQQGFDLILLAKFSESAKMEIRDSLLEQGIPPEKICSLPIFSGGNKSTCQLDLVEDLIKNLPDKQGMMFGLSYTVRGVRKEQLLIPFHDFSWHGLDLYYNCKLYLYACQKGLIHANTALLIFPYYFFDYDMSRSFYQYKTGQIFSTYRLDDWHHYRQCPGADDYVENYRLFGRKLSGFYHFGRYQYESTGVCSDVDGTTRLDPIWFTEYEETATENQNIFRQFLQSLLSHGIRVALVIPPFYLKGFDEPSAKAFSRKKGRFYHILRACDEMRHVKLFDFCHLFANHREFFGDLTHLNSAGAAVFTESINTQVLTKTEYETE